MWFGAMEQVWPHTQRPSTSLVKKHQRKSKYRASISMKSGLVIRNFEWIPFEMNEIEIDSSVLRWTKGNVSISWAVVKKSKKKKKQIKKCSLKLCK